MKLITASNSDREISRQIKIIKNTVLTTPVAEIERPSFNSKDSPLYTAATSLPG